ncbi:hypothetical protein F442_07528 [Phytophthora nicotianae P10297]|uniref:Uncharacterized protein n=1 Tax=Phytophthora nicotianae P10297 TaxID=1317064 RepID=W2ZFN0_PHYNI|nr:hypothetical protein F442_07528 [Phytophthora nicotianae P10297]
MRQAESILDDRTAVSASSERCMREFKVKLRQDIALRADKVETTTAMDRIASEDKSRSLRAETTSHPSPSHERSVMRQVVTMVRDDQGHVTT